MSNNGSEEKIRILLVNDDQAELYNYKRDFSYKCGETLEVNTFGPKEAGNAHSVGHGLINSFKTGKLNTDGVDILFMDFSMPGMNGVQLLETLNLENIKIPVVFMTKYLNEMLEEALKAIDIGARGYVHSGESPFYKEAEWTAQRVFMEVQRERWTEGLMEISSRLSSISDEIEMFDLVKKVLNQYSPKLKMFFRKLEGNVLVLVGSLNIPEEMTEKLYKFGKNEFSNLQEVCKNKCVHIYNSISELKGQLKKTQLEDFTKLSLDRGLSFPIMRSKNDIFGTISMYRRSIDPPFTRLEIEYAQVIVDQISLVWKARVEKKKGLAVSKYFSDFSKFKDIDELYESIVNHMHSYIHGAEKDTQHFKTTIKTIKPSTSSLFCNEQKHYIGAERDSDYMPKLYEDNTVSTWVALNNKPFLITDFDNPHELSQKNIQIAITSKRMKSELCVPIADEMSSAENMPATAILNLESSKKGFYTEENMEYALTICRLAGHYASKLRTEGFIKRILDMMSFNKDKGEMVRSSFDILKDLTGYYILVFVLKEGNEWVIADADIPPGFSKVRFINEMKERLNNPGGSLLRKAIDKGRKDPYFKKDITEKPEFWEPWFVKEMNKKIRSQAIFLLHSIEEPIGALSLDFLIHSPLTSEQFGYVKHFTEFLGSVFSQEERFHSLKVQLKESTKLAEFGEMFIHLSHKLTGRIHTLRDTAEILLNRCSLNQEEQAICDLAHKLDEELEEFAKLPSQMKTTIETPKTMLCPLKDIIKKVNSQLAAKAMKNKVKLIEPKSLEQYFVKADPNHLDMILYNLIDNAVDACSNINNGVIEVDTTTVNDVFIEAIIKDNGGGFKDPVRAFEIGYSTKSGGAGFGLSAAKRKIEEMNGYIRIDNIDNFAIVRIGIPIWKDEHK